MGRRDSSDVKWKRLKEKIDRRDRNTCRLMRILTVQDMHLLLRKAPRKLLERLDHAHVFGVGSFPHMCCHDLNIVLLNRYSHENLDNCRHPITGEPISRVERDGWWKKIVGESVYEELEKCSYKFCENTEEAI